MKPRNYLAVGAVALVFGPASHAENPMEQNALTAARFAPMTQNAAVNIITTKSWAGLPSGSHLIASVGAADLHHREILASELRL